MKNILIIGAGRSASSLISYLLDEGKKNNWNVRIGDLDEKLAQQKIAGHSNGSAFAFDISDASQREAGIKSADIIVSMLPAFMHGAVAKDCVRLGKHLVTASYISDEMRALDTEAKKKNIILLNEIGLDPGIDHMSAMEIIVRLKNAGAEIISFHSYCGGLVAPESNDNPWGYKFSWNPRNVILAGQGTALYVENGKEVALPYSRLFAEAKSVTVEGSGEYDAYANRDSLSYRSVYGLEHIPTMLRGTLRMKGFCKAWNVFVQLGLTDDSKKITSSEGMTYSALVNSILPGSGDLKKRLASFMKVEENDEIIAKVEWTGILSDERITVKNGSPAQILQELLERKWKLKETDKDLIVMQHEFIYVKDGKKKKIYSSLVVKGEDQVHTAMAKTVGLPAAIAVKNILLGKIKTTGVCAPVVSEIYVPVLNELHSFGINFSEREELV